MCGEKKYFWKDKPEIGSYDFCCGHSQNTDFYINEVNVHFAYGWTEEERREKFKDAKFVWGGCTCGMAYSNNPLKADNIEDAKKEFEVWYEQYLAGRIESLKKALKTAEEDYKCFLLYKKGN